MDAISRLPRVCKRFSVLNTDNLRKMHVEVAFPEVYLGLQKLGSFKVNWKFVFNVHSVCAPLSRKIDNMECKQLYINHAFETRKSEINAGTTAILGMAAVIADVAVTLIIHNGTN